MSLLERWYNWIASNPISVIGASLAVIVALGTLLPTLYKDTSPDAFIEPSNPALIYRDKVKETFGLSDPFVIAIEAPEGRTIYELETLRLVAELSDMVMATPNIDFDRVASLTTEKIISGNADEISITPAFEEPPESAEEVSVIRARIENFPIFLGSLVARDGSMTVIVGEMIDDAEASNTFNELSDSLDRAGADYGGRLHIAGEAAASGYLDDYISQDVRRSLPAAGLLIMLVLAAAFRAVSGVILPVIVAVGTVVVAMAARAYYGVAIFPITNALVVVLISISVADSIHIISEYRDELATRAHGTPRAALIAALVAISRPVTLTTVTTIAGFIGIWFGSDMPPMQAFGKFASIGVLAAWAFSLTFLPAVLSILHRSKPVDEVWAKSRSAKRPILAGILRGLAEVVVGYPKHAMFVSGTFLIICVGLTTLVEVDYSRIRNFAEDEEIFVADTVINQSMDGSYRLYVVVDGIEPQGILQPYVLSRIEDLQTFALGLENVNGATSIADILKEVNKGISGGDPSAYEIPDDPDSIAQLFLAYESLGDPADLEDDIDFDQRLTLVKLATTARSFREAQPIVAALEVYIAENFNASFVRGTLSGRVFLMYHWLKSIEANHFASILIAVVMAMTVAALTFRSFVGAFFCLYHVIFAVFMVYAVMGVLGIGLGITTSMFAAITIGLGIDFSVHSIERVRMLASAAGEVTPDTIRDAFQSTGRALWFNVWALCLGFSAMMASNNPLITEFAGLLIVAIVANFVASMTALPAVLLVLKPKFLIVHEIDLDRGPRMTGVPSGTFAILLAAGAVLFAAFSIGARAQEAPDLAQMVENVNSRDDGTYLTRDFRLVLTDRKGRERIREGKGLRMDSDSERRSMIVFERPSSIKDTAFLTYDYHDVDRDDQQWLYLPALRRSRRVAGADRGEYFLGTDLTFDDLKTEGRIGAHDYDFELESAGENTVAILGHPKTSDIADELGYGKIVYQVDTTNWTILEMRIFDLAKAPLKTAYYQGWYQVQGVWAIEGLFVENHKTNHKTLFEFTGIDFKTPVAAAALDQRNLKRAGK